MSLSGRKLGLMLSVPPSHPNFSHGVGLAQAAIERGVEVYLYCIDEAVTGVGDDRLQALRARGLRLFACAYAARRRGCTVSDQALFVGLGTLGDVIVGTDRFLSFN